jgi:hypothetical protein
MKPERFRKFEEWYDKNKYTPFSLRESLHSYGGNDTRILLASMLGYREILKNLTGGCDVLVTATTIAGIAMNIFKRCFLKPDTLGVVPEYGYERHEKGAR